MPVTAVLLVLCGALLHASWNALAKKMGAHGQTLHLVWLFSLLSLVPCVPLLFVWKDEIGLWLGQHDLAPVLMAAFGSAAVHIAYGMVLQTGYQRSAFTIVYPVARGTGPLISSLGSIVLLAEWPSAGGWVGLSLLLLGIGMISGALPLVLGMLSTKAGQSHAAQLEAHNQQRAGLIWGVATGFCIAAYTLIDGWAVKTTGIVVVAYYTLNLMGRVLLMLPWVLRDTRGLVRCAREHGRNALLVGVLSTLAYVMVLSAAQIAPLSYVAPLREVSMLLGMILGASVLREALTWQRITGTVLVVAGTACLIVLGA